MLWLELVYSDVNNIVFFLVGSFPPSQPEKIFLKRDAAALKVGERAFKGHPKKWEETLWLCLGNISVIPWQLSDDVIWGVSSVKVNVLVTVVSDCDPMDCSPPASFVHGILQARILEQVIIPFSRESSWPRDWTQVSCLAGRFFTIWATREAYHLSMLTFGRGRWNCPLEVDKH